MKLQRILDYLLPILERKKNPNAKEGANQPPAAKNPRKSTIPPRMSKISAQKSSSSYKPDVEITSLSSDDSDVDDSSLNIGINKEESKNESKDDEVGYGVIYSNEESKEREVIDEEKESEDDDE